MASERRQRKKQQTRELIADTAARLFAERGYEQVAIVDIARAADLSEQTIYNHFPSKEQLVLDLDQHLSDRLTELICARPPGTTSAAAIRAEARTFVNSIRSTPLAQARGGLGYLAAVSPTVRRLSLEMTDRHADAIAAAITDTTNLRNPQLAKIQGIALAWIFQTITDEFGRRTLAGQTPTHIANQLGPVIDSIINDLDRWLAASRSDVRESAECDQQPPLRHEA